ncbi:uncharacterized protein LOC114363549 [Ostrinia furnacalis]|uniref:uncharacterized protein LOC114363549 n=1 Tax=Ostrinia furnacalis TaxID=93504 RepID=UPI00103E20F6|nr:uncharacterized protein LOC114363549 [Ostrinia furnacalis]XP_028175107.1 uncharacterized protein LOC114363549 [Ostrinia furnacalis]
MSYLSFFAVVVIFWLCLSSFVTFGEESSEEEASPREEYMHIFQNIPVLFEYFLFALQDKPEILETDNPMAFNDINNNNNAKELDKRDVSDEKQAASKDGSNARIADDIFDEVEGLDDPDGADDETSSQAADNPNSEVKYTPEEVAEKCLMVEQMLEEYNKN